MVMACNFTSISPHQSVGSYTSHDKACADSATTKQTNTQTTHGEMATGGGETKRVPSYERQNTEDVADLPLKIPVSSCCIIASTISYR